jgi:hypothetical protein
MRGYTRLTIREYFRGRSKRARLFLGVGAIVAVVSAAGFAMTSNFNPIYSYLGTAADAVGVGVVFGALLYLDRTKCPNCGQRLGIHIANQYSVGRRVAFCPFCGASFDKCEVRNP